jgi:hypothetical protein
MHQRRCHRWTSGSPPQDAEFVPEHHDLQLFEVARSTEKDDKLEKVSQQDVHQRNEHEASDLCV